jgi:hypothetical protein
MTMTKAIYIGTLNGKPLRFFESPNPGPQFPWHSTDDIFKCMGLDHGARNVFRKMINEHAEWSKEVRIIDTDSGLVTIGPHFMAQGLIEAMVMAGRVSKTEEELDDEYTVAAMEAAKVLTDGMTGEEGFRFMMAAAKSHQS